MMMLFLFLIVHKQILKIQIYLYLYISLLRCNNCVVQYELGGVLRGNHITTR